MTQTKRPLSNNGTIHPDPYGASPRIPRGSTLDMKTSSTEGREGHDQRWGSSRNGGYYKNG